jgi:hypothetical protein
MAAYTPEEINAFEHDNRVKLPDRLSSFLRVHGPGHYGDVEIYRLDQIDGIYEDVFDDPSQICFAAQGSPGATFRQSSSFCFMAGERVPGRPRLAVEATARPRAVVVLLRQALKFVNAEQDERLLGPRIHEARRDGFGDFGRLHLLVGQFDHGCLRSVIVQPPRFAAC